MVSGTRCPAWNDQLKKWSESRAAAPKGQFLVADTQLYKRLCPSVRRLVSRLVGRLVGRSVTLELKSWKTCISAPAHPSATDGRVSGLV